MKRYRSNVYVKTAYVLLIAGVCALLIEVLFRGLWAVPSVREKIEANLIYRYHTLGPTYQMYCREASYLRFKPVAGNPEIQTDSWGFRNPELPVERTAGTRRIAFLGSSTTFDSGDLEQTYPYLVNEILNRNHVHSEYLNASAHAYTSNESVMNYRFRVTRFKPDVVVVYDGRNDLILSGLTHPNQDLTEALNIYDGLQYPSETHKKWARNSILYIVFSELFTSNSFRRNNIFSLPDEKKGLLPKTKDEFLANIDRSDLFVNFRRNMETLGFFTEQDSAQLVLLGFDVDFSKLEQFMPIPGDRPFTPEELRLLDRKLDSLNTLSEEVAARYNHIHFYNLRGQIDPKHYVDDCHLDREGKAIKAEKVAAYLLSLNLPGYAQP